MSDERRCGQCGAELASQTPHGLCPACLLRRGLETQTAGLVSGEPSSTTAAAPTPAELASHFPELEILELVGRGGMGVVYKARQKQLDRLVALKILSPNIAREPAFAERFTREARALAMLSHPHVVAVYDFGRTDDLYYFLMEFVDGVNLRRLLDQGQVTPQQSLAIIPQICEALQFAHDRGVVHRDIKPENILLDRQGQVKIADFGLAKLIGRRAQDPSLTGSGQVMGTPLYMAPEQMEHPQEVDHRADIYSLGVVFYQMLTGELPLGRFALPSRKVQIDVRLDEVVLHALEKEPERRYQHASEVKSDVDVIAASSQAGAAASPPTRDAAWLRPIVVVGRRGGQAVIHGPGVAISLAITVAILVGAAAIASLAWKSRIDTAAVLIAFFSALTITAIRIRRGRTIPVDRLLSLDELPAGWDASRDGLPSIPPLVHVARWTARGLGLLGFLFVLSFILAEGFPPFWQQPPSVQVEMAAMLTMLVGLLLGWRNELWGVLLIAGGWLVFLIVERGWPPVPFTCFLLVAALFAVGWWSTTNRRCSGRAGNTPPFHEKAIRAVPESPPADERTLDLVRRQVKGPSLGLVLTSLLNWLAIFALLPVMMPYAARREVSPELYLLAAGILALGSGVILVGALKMQHLESLVLARLASVLAMLVGPGYLIGWPVGIWSLVVLSRREVRDGFLQHRRPKYTARG